MAEDVRVKINDATIISALNTPGGAVNEWRNGVEEEILNEVYLASPVNDVLDQLHREEKGDPHLPGDFQRSWVTRRYGNQHRVGFQIENFADHAIYVEEGRSGSTKFQLFSWKEYGGELVAVGGEEGGGTAERDGLHILRDVTNRVLERETGGSYTPLV